MLTVVLTTIEPEYMCGIACIKMNSCINCFGSTVLLDVLCKSAIARSLCLLDSNIMLLFAVQPHAGQTNGLPSNADEGFKGVPKGLAY